jgi:hypothetical protein
MRLIPVLAAAVALTWGLEAPERLRAQTELDRVVGRVNNRIITQSDIRQAMLLKLVDDTSTEESTRRGLENRILILAELPTTLPPASESDLAARRNEWEAGIGGRSRVADLLGRTSMKETGLDSWLRDDVRIRMHVREQFGRIPEGDRAKATSDWIARLRQRAGLK